MGDRQARFLTTRWSVLEALDGDTRERDAAMAYLVAVYWPAVYAYLRRAGRDEHDAADVAQGFFADVVLARDLFDRADRAKGRLRTFMIKALRNYAASHDRKRRRHERIQSVDPAVIAREEAELSKRNGETPEAAFDRAWATSLLDECLRRCEAHYRAAGLESHWRLFEARVVNPAVRAVEPRPVRELAEETGMTAPAASAAIQTVKRRFETMLTALAHEAHPAAPDTLTPIQSALQERQPL